MELESFCTHQSDICMYVYEYIILYYIISITNVITLPQHVLLYVACCGFGGCDVSFVDFFYSNDNDGLFLQ